MLTETGEGETDEGAAQRLAADAGPSEPESVSEKKLLRQVEKAVAATEAPMQEFTDRSTAGSAVSYTTLIPGLAQRDRLQSAEDVKYYSFSAKERGVLQVSLTSVKRMDLAGFTLSIFGTYYLNGTDGEKGVRLLHSEQIYSNGETYLSPNIGIGSGTYYLAVSSGYYPNLNSFELILSFTAGTQYEIECNDTPARYTEIYSGVPVKGSASVLTEKQDLDWYMMRMHTNGALSILFSHEAGSSQNVLFKITVYDAQMREIYTGLSYDGDAVLRSGSLGVPEGYCFVCVESRARLRGDYTMTVGKDSADLYEKEPNDSADTPTLIQNGRPVIGSLQSRGGEPDRDHYRFPVDADGVIRLSLEADPVEPDKNDPVNAVRRLTLTDGEGHILYQAQMLQTDPLIQSGEIGIKAGVYDICVDHDGLYAGEGNYSLRAVFEPKKGYELEFNGEPGSASALSLNSACKGMFSSLASGADTDWYTFEIINSGQYTLSFTHDASDADGTVMKAELYHADANEKLADKNGETLHSLNGDRISDAFLYILAPGRYYLKISPGLFTFDGAYTVCVSTGS